jgi:hypothetical protein
MLKKRIIAIVTGLALLAAVATGVAADSLGLQVTPQAHACQSSGSSGGGC